MTWRWLWPWRRRREVVSGESAARAKVEAQARLVAQRRRWPEVEQARDKFAALVDQALRGAR